MATPVETRIKNDLRKFLRENKGVYRRAKAILDDKKVLKEYEDSALELIRLYKIGDSGEIAIGLLAAAGQLLATVDVARENVQKFDDRKKRLEEIEGREEESKEPEEL